MTNQCLKCGVELREGPVIFANDTEYYCLRCAPNQTVQQRYPDRPGEVFICNKCNEDINDWQNLVRKNEWFLAWSDHKRVMTYYHTRCFIETKLSLTDD